MSHTTSPHLQDSPDSSSQLLTVEVRGLQASAPLPQRRNTHENILQSIFLVNCSEPVLRQRELFSPSVPPSLPPSPWTLPHVPLSTCSAFLLQLEQQLSCEENIKIIGKGIISRPTWCHLQRDNQFIQDVNLDNVLCS